MEGHTHVVAAAVSIDERLLITPRQQGNLSYLFQVSIQILAPLSPFF
jgi:hypothetical protein